MSKTINNFLALLPLGVFIAIYLVVSIILNDFYKVPIAVAFLVASVVAIATLRGRGITERIKVFSEGASSENVMLMIWIFILAGAFASSAKTMGSIDATVNLTLSLLPSQMLLAGLFAAACFISLSMGTSVGTIVALVPIAAGAAEHTGGSVSMLTAAIVGGAFFGDNLSFISDTTVVATQSQGCRMNEKFKANIRIVMPAAIVVFVLYLVIGFGNDGAHALDTSYRTSQWVLVLPYLAVLVLAVAGINVLVVLTIGSVLAGITGIANGSYDVFGWMHSMSEGILGMSELIIVTMLAAGMLEVIKANGGINAIIRFLTNHVSNRRGAEVTIALLVSVVNVCTANNTVAILTIGEIVRDISHRFGIAPRRAASLLDTFSCFTQGLLPYGAQLLMAGGLACIAPTEIIPYLFYPFAIGLSAMLFIVFNKK